MRRRIFIASILFLLFMGTTPACGTYMTNREVVKLFEQGRYQEAIALAEKTLAEREKAYGPDDPRVAFNLNNLAKLYESMGRYQEALPMYERARDIYEKKYGPDHQYVAVTLNNLAALHNLMGDYENVESLYLRAIDIFDKTKGEDSVLAAQSINNLAEFYDEIGEFQKSEPLKVKALEILKKRLGPDDPKVAIALNNLANLYQDLGDYEKAESLHRQALAIDEKALGPDHPMVATDLNNLSKALADQGKWREAEKLNSRALEINRKAFGEKHPRVAENLNNLARIKHVLGDVESAAELYGQAQMIKLEILGPNHISVALSWNNLGLLAQETGDYALAEKYYLRAQDIKESLLGPVHPDVSLGYANLGMLAADQGDYPKAHELFQKAEKIDDQLIDQVMGFTAESQKLKFLATKELSMAGSISLVATELADNPAARKDAMNLWLKRKGIILEAQRRFQEAVVYSGDPEAREVFQELARVRARLSRLVMSGPGREGPQTHQARIAELNRERDRLEARLSQLSRGFAIQKKKSRADVVQVAQALPPGTALVEFARIRFYNYRAAAGQPHWEPPQYLAFVVLAGREDAALVPLGQADPIDRAVMDFKRAVTNLNDLKGLEAGKAASRLHNTAFAPIQKALGPTREIFISPDGNLNLIPFEVLKNKQGKYLIDDYTFYYLSAGRDILGFDSAPKSGGQAVLIGDPDFDMNGETRKDTLKQLRLADVGESGFSSRSADAAGLHFSPLPGTREEVQSIEQILGLDATQVYIGEKALEEVLLSLSNPRILHLATHGFFLDDMNVEGLADRSALNPTDTREKVRIDNPLLRSGLAMAGANQSTDNQSGSDGLLTAEKVLSLNLSGTELVVLSACETGVGEVKQGEGVFGLRRAFTRAGARSMVMSMWSVPDLETKELMVTFYQELNQGELNRGKALRQAALAEKAKTEQRYGHTNPLFWGAFVFLGQP
jgi:CHAT domain-containing protein/Tfp pilus assembly protein PilF